MGLRIDECYNLVPSMGKGVVKGPPSKVQLRAVPWEVFPRVRRKSEPELFADM